MGTVDILYNEYHRYDPYLPLRVVSMVFIVQYIYRTHRYL
jgi:hypothetical protein